MAWASVGRAGSTGNATANASTMGITLNGQVGSGADANDLLVLVFAMGSSTTTAAVTTRVTAVTDTSSNHWFKAQEFLGPSASSLNMVCSIWYTNVDTPLTTASVVTVVHSTRAGQAAIVWRFTHGQGSVLCGPSTYTATNGSSSPGSLDQAGPATDLLRVRGAASRTTLTAMSTTAGWTTMGTTRASATVLTSVFGEFRITSASTAASSPILTGHSTQSVASVYTIFEDCQLMGGGEL
jgi:hypothetical protein